ncbi:YncE family protein, partial [Athalassotoga sp.]|uniref:YncE family protein n=1 Tax=Athalassotoga sp. TaxID=2022597 RepID=UPI003D08971C
MMKILIFLAIAMSLNFILSPFTFHTVQSIQVGGRLSAICFDPSTEMAYVANSSNNTLSVVNEETNQIVKVMAVEKYPMSVGVNSKTGIIYVAVNYNLGNSSIDVLDKSGQTISVINVGMGPNAIGVNSVTNMIYVTNQSSDDVNVIDGSTNKIISTIPVGNGPDAVAVDSDT